MSRTVTIYREFDDDIFGHYVVWCRGEEGHVFITDLGVCTNRRS